MRGDFVNHGAGLGHPRPADDAWHAIAAFPVRVLLVTERRSTTVGPGETFRAVVSGIHDDRVVGDAQLVALLEQLSDLRVVLDHAIGVDPEASNALRFRLKVRPDMHARRVPPEEEGLV